MWRRLVGKATRALRELARIFESAPAAALPRNAAQAIVPAEYEPLERVRLTDEVGRTLFEEFAEHRAGNRCDEETGWVLLGLREKAEAVVLATLPAGAQRQAGVAHVQFNSTGQALGSRIVRQANRRLSILGVVHTHPGSLRHPSDGDYEGDSAWVGQLRGGEGIFGIGTADGKGENESLVARQPKPHVQLMGDLCLSWYTLREGDRRYRPVAVDLTLGPDLARPLHPLWPTIEAHADRLDRLCRQQIRVTFDVVTHRDRASLAATIKLAEPGEALRVILEKEEVAYYLVRGGEMFAVDLPEPRVDRGVYLLLADLAGQC
jgi:proteasome lid subunit RPN8/RPN11